MELHSGNVNEWRDRTPLHLYLPGQHRDVWKCAGARKLQKDYPVQVTDQAGFRGCIPIMGLVRSVLG
jgi:hypothetical protein